MNNTCKSCGEKRCQFLNDSNTERNKWGVRCCRCYSPRAFETPPTCYRCTLKIESENRALKKKIMDFEEHVDELLTSRTKIQTELHSMVEILSAAQKRNS